MQQLTDIVLDFNAFLRDGKGRLLPFSLRVRHPVLDDGLSFSCVVECPFLRPAPFRIPGVDNGQACTLSSSFIRLMLKDTDCTLIDRDGNPVPIPDVPVSWAYNILDFC